MKCLFCGSDDLKTVQTHSKNEFIQASKIGSRDDGTGGIEVFSEPFELAVTRRKMRCNNCKQHRNHSSSSAGQNGSDSGFRLYRGRKGKYRAEVPDSKAGEEPWSEAEKLLHDRKSAA